jgi:hypothetical protein
MLRHYITTDVRVKTTFYTSPTMTYICALELLKKLDLSPGLAAYWLRTGRYSQMTSLPCTQTLQSVN